jgi:beta-galactosidase
VIFSVEEQTVIAQNLNKKIKQERLCFDKSWKFHLGDVPFPEIKTHEES